MRLLSQIKAVLASNPSLADAPCEVDSIEVRRNEKNPTRTKDYVVQRAFKAAKNAKTLRELSDAIQAGALNLEGLESYNSAKITLDTAGKDNEKVKVVVDLDEMRVGRVWRFGAEIDSKKRADLSGKVGMRNKLGHGELFQLEGSLVPARRLEDYSIKADFELPQVFGGVGKWSNSLNFLTQNSITSQLLERDEGFTSSAQLNARHNFTYSLLRRKLFLKTAANKKADEKEGEASAATITTLPANVPIPEAKDTVSSSITHTFTLNKLNDDDFPSKGYLFRARNTLAGLYGGDVRLFKSELEANTYFPIIRSLVANLQFTVGSAIPFEKTQKISISDRFFEPLRGYPNLIGPVDPNTNAIVGGNFKSTLLARLNFPLSFFPVLRDFLNAQGHFFFNAGNVADFDFSKADDTNYADAFYKSFVDTMKMSYGLGLFIVLSGVRLEVNYTVPIQSTEKGVDASYKNGKVGLYICNNV